MIAKINAIFQKPDTICLMEIYNNQPVFFIDKAGEICLNMHLMIYHDHLDIYAIGKSLSAFVMAS